MNTNEILMQIDAEIDRLQQVKAILSNTTGIITKAKRGPQAKTAAPLVIAAKRRKISPEGRARIAAAQKARWAKSKKASKAA
jgi:hypothetical protein